jgi:hypothetical protein
MGFDARRRSTRASEEAEIATEETTEFVSGISLGQANESTALAILERGAPKADREYDRPLSSFFVRSLDRFPIGTSYPTTFERVTSLFQAKPLPGNVLVVDQTAVGDPVLRMLWRAKTAGGIRRVVITDGLTAALDSQIWQVPKEDLVGTLQFLFQEQRLKIAADLPEAPTLVDELIIPAIDNPPTKILLKIRHHSPSEVLVHDDGQ